MENFTSKSLSASTVVIEISNRFTELERDQFFDDISIMIDSGVKFVVIDCHKLGFLTSGGLAGLLAARKRVSKKGGKIYLTNMSSHIIDSIKATKLSQVLSVYPTNKAAIDSLRNDPRCVG